MSSIAATQPFDMNSPVLLAQPVLERVLTYFFPSLVVIVITYATLTDYSRNETATGEVTAANGFSAVVADQSGIVSTVNVRLDQAVAKGDSLGILSLPKVVTAEGDTTASAIRRMTTSLANMDMQLAEYGSAIALAQSQMAEGRRSADVSLRAADARRTITGTKQQMLQKRLQDYEALAQKGFVARSKVDEARLFEAQLFQEATDADLTISELRRGQEERLALLANRVSDLRQATLTLQTQRLQTEKQLDDLGAQQSLEIVAPERGVIAAISVRPGQRVEAGQRIFAVAQPSARLTVALEVPSKAIGLVETGQRVALKYDAFPYQSFGVRYGRITRVEQVSIQTGKQSTPEESRNRMFLVEVSPQDKAIMAYGRPRPLRVGMTVTAEIEVERRKLINWFLSPLLALRGRVG